MAKITKVDDMQLQSLLFTIYVKLRKSDKMSMRKVIEEADLPPDVHRALARAKIVENVGGKGLTASWKWLPAGQPDPKMAAKVLTAWREILDEYKEKASKFPTTEVKEADGKPVIEKSGASLYIKERLEIVERQLKDLKEQNDFIEDALRTILTEYDVKYTIGGRKVSKDSEA